MLTFLYNLGKISLNCLGLITKYEVGMESNLYNDCDSDLEEEINRKNIERDERAENLKNGIEHTETPEEFSIDSLKEKTVSKGMPLIQNKLYFYQLNSEAICQMEFNNFRYFALKISLICIFLSIEFRSHLPNGV